MRRKSGPLTSYQRGQIKGGRREPPPPKRGRHAAPFCIVNCFSHDLFCKFWVNTWRQFKLDKVFGTHTRKILSKMKEIADFCSSFYCSRNRRYHNQAGDGSEIERKIIMDRDVLKEVNYKILFYFPLYCVS